jgi:hypothetical protein
MNGTIQLGPRSGAALGRSAARHRAAVAVVLLAVALAAEVAGVLWIIALHSAPATGPTAFCPAGQRVVAITASGWPVCGANR